ncbi:MAG: NAD(P)/FAD-dependent oxidoreductase [Negativicutes bacterium]|jgi:digeranylgeranylglycerophospholipid reductase
MKIAIIGAGPAGVYAAITAATHGAEVTVFEKRCVGEGIVCGECIFDFFGTLQQPRYGYRYTVENIIVHAHNTYTKAVAKYNRLWMMDRSAWQRGLAAEAVGLGVKIHENKEILPAQLRQLSQEFDFIIDCSGAPSVTGQAYGFHSEYLNKFNVACQYELRGDFSKFKKSILIGFLPDIPAENMPGYYWIFPKDDQSANVGIGYRTDTKGKTVNLWQKLDEVIRLENLQTMTITGRGGGFLPISRPNKLVHDNILLVGDAAGITSEFSGEGIDLACISGTLAARAILDGDVSGYQNRLNLLLKEKFALDKTITKYMQNSNLVEIDGLVDAVFNKKIILNPRTMTIAYKLLKMIVLWKIRKRIIA